MSEFSVDVFLVWCALSSAIRRSITDSDEWDDSLLIPDPPPPLRFGFVITALLRDLPPVFCPGFFREGFLPPPERFKLNFPFWLDKLRFIPPDFRERLRLNLLLLPAVSEMLKLRAPLRNKLKPKRLPFWEPDKLKLNP